MFQNRVLSTTTPTLVTPSITSGFSTETLAATTHDHLLGRDARTHIVLDLAQHGAGTAACGPGVLPQYQLHARPLRGVLEFRVS